MRSWDSRRLTYVLPRVDDARGGRGRTRRPGVEVPRREAQLKLLPLRHGH